MVVAKAERMAAKKVVLLVVMRVELTDALRADSRVERMADEKAISQGD